MDVVWHYGNVLYSAPTSAQKQLKAHLPEGNKTLHIPLIIVSTASTIIGGSGDVCSTTYAHADSTEPRSKPIKHSLSR